MDWLPSELPPNCSLLLSTSKDSAAFGTTAMRGWTDVVVVPKLGVKQKEQLVVRVLETYHKTLEPHMLIMLSRAKQTANPLFLHMVLEELLLPGPPSPSPSPSPLCPLAPTPPHHPLTPLAPTLSPSPLLTLTLALAPSPPPSPSPSPFTFTQVLEELLTNAVFETVQALLEMCLKQPSAPALVIFLLERLEAQFGMQLVGRTLSFLEASRFGISEAELLEALQISQADWAPFFAAVRWMLCESAGLLNVSVRVIREAVTARYFPDPASACAVHQQLVSFFTSATPETVSEVRRRGGELPYPQPQPCNHDTNPNHPNPAPRRAAAVSCRTSWSKRGRPRRS